MRDFLPADVRKREYVIDIIKQVYESYGFEPLETPAVENIETLMGKYGEEGNQLIFKILKRGEKLRQEMDDAREELGESDLSDLALRYDLTVPLARVVANHKNDLPKFFKRYQIQPVWRADRPARGRFREFYQCDVDVIGSTSMAVEAEQIAAVSDVLTRLGFTDFVIRVNHRAILGDIVSAAGIAEDKASDALVALDKLDKIGSAGVEKELRERGIPPDKALGFVSMFESFEKLAASYSSDTEHGSSAYNQEFIRRWESDTEAGDETNRALVEDLRQLMELTEAGGVSRWVRIDPSLARGLSYYTGTIMEISVDGIGSLGGGGRYDGLIGMFGKEQIPACGFSLGLERILVVMDERNMFPPEIADSTPADIIVTIWSEDTIAESIKLANKLRRDGFRATIYPEADKLGKQLKYADSIGVPFVCVLGETELAEGKVTLKNMRSGEQVMLVPDEIVNRLKAGR